MSNGEAPPPPSPAMTTQRYILHPWTNNALKQLPLWQTTALHCSIDSSMPRKSLILVLTVASAAVRCSSARLLIGDVIAESEVRDFVDFYSLVLSPSLIDDISERINSIFII